MGGQSFRCPLCKQVPKWVLTRAALKDHLRDKHGLIKVDLTDGPEPVITLAERLSQTHG